VTDLFSAIESGILIGPSPVDPAGAGSSTFFSEASNRFRVHSF
jgi:hypothetical protein